MASLNVLGFGSGSNRITTMQDMTSTVCNSVNLGTSGRLEDKRDHKVYWVTRLNDGLCWMTQNLDLDLTTNGLTSQLSDMNSDWNQNSASENPSRTIPTKTLTTSELNTTSWPANNTQSEENGYHMVRSYDPGLAVFTNGTTRKELTDKRWEMGQDFWLTLAEVGGNDTWTATYEEGFINATQYVATDGQTICNKTAGKMLGDMTSTYIPCRIYYYEYLKASVFYGVTLEDLHWSQGNYYSFNAATAGSGKNKTANDTTSSDPAPDSICPKGWKLPLSGSGNGLSASAASGSFGLMLNKQNVASSAAGSTAIRTSPLYYLYGGFVNNGSLSSAGSPGRYWSSTSFDASIAYGLAFASGGVYPSDTNSRYLGFPVRCVAR